MATPPHQVVHITCSPPATRRWSELVCMVNVSGTAALMVLMLEVVGVHPGGVLMGIWRHLLGLYSLFAADGVGSCRARSLGGSRQKA